MRRSSLHKLSILAISLTLGLVPASLQGRTIWASDSNSFPNSVIYSLDADTGAVLTTLPVGPGSFIDALSFSNDGNSIFILDSSTNSDVFQIDLAGNLLNSFDVALDAEGLTILRDGSLVIGGGGSNVVAFVNPLNGAILSSFVPVGQLYGLASNGTDRLYGLRINGVIDTYDLAGNLISTLNTGVSGTTLGLAYTGSSFFISSVGSTITEIGLNGGVLNSFAGPGGFTEGLDYPIGVQVPDVPEPATFALGGLGLGALALLRRRK